MKKITFSEYNKFRKEWYADPRGLRFGQAFYHRFRGYKGVEEADQSHNLFYATDVNHIDYTICHVLQLIDWEE